MLLCNPPLCTLPKAKHISNTFVSFLSDLSFYEAKHSNHLQLWHCASLYINVYVQGMEYLHAKGIPHGLLTSSSITLHHRVCISLAPPHTRHAHHFFHPHHLTYLPPECVRQLHVVQRSSPSPVSPAPITTTVVQSDEALIGLSSLESTNCLTYERSGAARSRAPSSPPLQVAMATGGSGSSKLCRGKRGSDSCTGTSIYGEQLQMVGSQLRTKMPPTTAADVFAFG